MKNPALWKRLSPVAILLAGGLAGALALLWSGETEDTLAHAASASARNTESLLVGSWVREGGAGGDASSSEDSDRLFFSSGGTFRREARYRSGPMRFSSSTGPYRLEADHLTLGAATWHLVALSEGRLELTGPDGRSAAYRRGS